MSRTTKSWWDKTTDLLDPFPDDKPKNSDSMAYGVFEDSKKKPVQKESWMSGLWKSDKKKDDDIKTIGDWMDQKRLD